MQVEGRLKEMGIALPEAPPAVAAYVPWVRTGNLVVTSGQLPWRGAELAYSGRLGDQLDERQGYQAARLCALNAIAQLKAAVGDLDRIARIVRLEGNVHSAPGFRGHPQVLNGASDLFNEVFGERGRHTRTALGISDMPLDSPVQLSVWAELSDALSTSAVESKTKIAHFTIATRDVRGSADFFETTLGWKEIKRPGNIGQTAAWLAIAEDQELHLIEVVDFEPSPFEREFGRHLAISCPLDEFEALKFRLFKTARRLSDPSARHRSSDSSSKIPTGTFLRSFRQIISRRRRSRLDVAPNTSDARNIVTKGTKAVSRLSTKDDSPLGFRRIRIPLIYH